jgi:DNA-directed RNA polymerase specialized sigma24 family protein
MGRARGRILWGRWKRLKHAESPLEEMMLRALMPRYLMDVIKYDLQGMTNKQVAAAMNTTPGSTKVMRCRAKRWLRAYVELQQARVEITTAIASYKKKHATKQLPDGSE